jgi:hypothetical protein
MIYFIQDKSSDFIKIGFTQFTAKERLKALEGGNPNELGILCEMDGNIDDERNLHKRFQIHRHRGEWFHPHKEILDFIEMAKPQQEDLTENNCNDFWEVERKLEKSRQVAREKIGWVGAEYQVAG